MAVANLANIPDSDETWSEYSFSLQGTLRDINRAILSQKNIALSEYILDPLNVKDPTATYVQLFGLQTMMNNINAVLGTEGYDYIDVDLSKPEERAGWTWLLFTNIKQAAEKLGVG